MIDSPRAMMACPGCDSSDSSYSTSTTPRLDDRTSGSGSGSKHVELSVSR
eukprot:COSAG06_NODE_1739_length_8515_cov_19.652804_10_plen_50_part_00